VARRAKALRPPADLLVRAIAVGGELLRDSATIHLSV
jgi:hypothetical protein